MSRMDRVKRMILIDPAASPKSNSTMPPSIHSSQERVNNTLKMREINALDKQLLDVINNHNLSDEEKVATYNQTLSKFQGVFNKKNEFTDAVKSPAVNREVPAKLNDQLILAPIPKVYQNKARNLLNFLLDKPSFLVSSDGDVNINGKSLDNANITDLLNKAVNPKHTLGNDLSGWDSFRTYLQERKSPRSLFNPTATKLSKEKNVTEITETPIKARGSKKRLGVKETKDTKSGKQSKRQQAPAWLPY